MGICKTTENHNYTARHTEKIGDTQLYEAISEEIKTISLTKVLDMLSTTKINVYLYDVCSKCGDILDRKESA